LRIDKLSQISNQGEEMGAMQTKLNPSDKLRSGRIAAAITGVLAAMALMLALPSANANAADLVDNPGTYNMTWLAPTGDDGMRFSPSRLTQSDFPLTEVTYQVNVAANGNITPVSAPTFPSRDVDDYCYGTNIIVCLSNPGVRATPQVLGDWTGHINPVTGAMTYNMPMRIRTQHTSGSNANNCYIGWSGNPIAIAGSTTGAGGEAYNRSTASGRLVAAGHTSPTITTETGGGPASSCNSMNSRLGLPSSDSFLRFHFTLTNASTGEPVRPWPVRPSFVANPDPVGEGDTVTLDASASVIENGVELCENQDVSEPDCGYRWDFDGDDVIDAVTNGPTVQTSYPDAGNYSPKLTIFDTVGKSDTYTGSVWVQVHPVAQIDTTPDPVTKETSNVFTFSIPDNPYDATTQCSIDWGPFTGCESGDTFAFVQADDATGSHNFRVRGITPGGVAGPADSHDFTIDRVKPRVTIAEGSKPADPTNVTSANFTFTADKPGSTLECQLDGGPWEPCGTNSSGSKAYSGLTEEPNPHQFRVRATDPLGNIGGDGNPGGGGYDWRVDLTAPVPSFTEKPAQPSNVVSPLFTWTSDEPVQLAQCRLKVNGAVSPWNACQTLVSQQFTDLEDADYEFAIRVLDIAGNWSEILSHAWLLETVAPNLEITSGPPELSTRSLAQFFYDHEDGVDLECQLDDREVQNPCPSGTKYAYLDDGAHFFTVTATDAALNFTTRTHSWSVKTSQPAVQIEPGSVPASSSTVDTAEFELVTVNGDAECRLDGGAWEACESNEGQSYSGLADGNHTFEVRAVDEYGNVSAIDAYSWLVVTAAPEVTITSGPASNTKLTSASFGFEVESADPTIVTECSLDGETFACSDPASVVGLEDGDHTFTVTATDTAGIQGHDTYEWRVKAKIPGLGFDEVPNALSNTADATFAFSSDEDPDVAYECKLDAGAWEACESPVSKTGLGQGNHTFSIRATDPVGNAAIETYQWNVDTVAPTVTFGSKPAATTSDVAEIITFTASEGGATFECSLDDAAFTACASPTLLKGLAKGAHSFRVRATDETGNQGAVATANWTINGPAVAGSPSSTQSNAASVTAPATQPKSSGNAKEAAPKAKTTAKKAKKAKKKSKKNKRAKKAKKARSKR
jgi:hypothetical protein